MSITKEDLQTELKTRKDQLEDGVTELNQASEHLKKVERDVMTLQGAIAQLNELLARFTDEPPSAA